MKTISKLALPALTVLLLGQISACGTFNKSKKAKKSTAPTGELGDQSQLPKTDEPKKDDGNPDSGDQAIPLKIGEVATAKGDVVKDEDGLFSLTRVFSFTLDKASNLQVRKSYSNGNCGPASTAFVIVQGENQLADVSIDPSKDYDGVPQEKFATAFAPGSYNLITLTLLAQECKNMMFYYDFFLEEQK